MKKSTVFGRICILFLSIVIPWLLLSCILLTSAINRITASSIQVLSQSRTASIQTFENEIVDTYTAAGLSNAMDRAVSLSTLNDIMSKYDRSQAINQIQESLSLIKTMSSLTENARIYIEPMNVIYNSSPYAKGSVQAMSSEQYDHIATLANSTFSFVIDSDRLVLLRGNLKSNPTCIIEIELSQSAMKRQIEQNLEYPKESRYSLVIGNEDLTIHNFENEVLLSVSNEKALGSDSTTVTPLKYDRTSYYLYSYHSSLLNLSFFELIPASLVVHPVQLTTYLTAIFVVLTFAVVMIFLIQSNRLIHKPLLHLTSGFDLLRKGNFSVRVEKPETADFAYLYDGFNYMAGDLEQLVKKNYQQALLLKKAELRQLQSQINPHFLYNSFFLLQRIIDSEDTEQASMVASELGQYFRYITKQNTDTVTLEDEYDHARVYANIQSLRFMNRIEVSFAQLPEVFSKVQVPKLFLQPIIENAFKYGLENKISEGLLLVSCSLLQTGDLQISVEDNGQDLSNEQLQKLQFSLEDTLAQSSVDNLSGILNISKRMQLFYQDTSTIRFSRASIGGLSVSIKIPKPMIGGQ